MTSPTAEPSASPPEYAGLATRTIAFIIDVILIDLVAVIVGAAGALIVSFFRVPHEAQTVLKLILAGGAISWAAGYFVGFWYATGQTPGNRVMQIRVQTTSGGRVRPGRGVIRCVGLVLAALPLFAGYVLILFDRQRRGLQDRMAGTVVVEAPDLSLAAARRVRQRAASQAARAGATGSADAPVDGDAPPPSADAAGGRLESITVTR